MSTKYSMDHPNVNMVTSSFDRITGSLGSPIYQPYNNFRIQNQGGNIIQGQMNKLSITEVMFPYTSATIITGQNDLISILIHQVTYPTGEITVPIAEHTFRLPAGYYTAVELALALNAVEEPDTGVFLSDYLNISVNSGTKALIIESATSWSAGANYLVEMNPDFFVGLGPIPPSAFKRNPFNYPNLLWTMGYRNTFATTPPILFDQYDFPPTPDPPSLYPLQISVYPTGMPASFAPSNSFAYLYGSLYTGRYTDYIDIVSRSLCQAQYTRDSTTSQNTPQRDVIARIYVCTNVSTYLADPVGSRPFIIHRMFPVPKIMKWTADRSIDAIDLALYDMYGQPLPNTQGTGLTVVDSVPNKFNNAGQADYAITFHVHEGPAEQQNENVGYKY